MYAQIQKHSTSTMFNCCQEDLTVANLAASLRGNFRIQGAMGS